MPWFANGSGLLYFLSSPSSGFLWGFLPMVFSIGFLSDKLEWRENKLKIFYLLVIGQLILYIVGLSHAYFIILPNVDWMNIGSEMLQIYLYPFIFGDILKTFIACTITIKMVEVAKRR